MYSDGQAEEILGQAIRGRRDRVLISTKGVPQVALNWLLGRPTVSTVVIGARNEEQLRRTWAPWDGG